jgi:serine/threonine-protein phosphatase 2A catalytic subunit
MDGNNSFKSEENMDSAIE